MESGGWVRPCNSALPWNFILVAGEPCVAGMPVDGWSVGNPILIGSRSSVSGHRYISQIRIVLSKGDFVQAKVRHNSRGVIFDYHVYFGKHLDKKVSSFLLVEFDHG